MKSLKILLLCDVGENPPANQDFSADLKTEDWEGEAALVRTLKALGHEVKMFGLFDSIDPLYRELTDNRPDLVFNQCESFAGERHYEPYIAGLLELLRIPYTGASPLSLALCKDKGFSKKVLNYHRVLIPRFVVSHRSRPIRKLTHLRFPTFTKPLGLEGSEGIAQVSFSENEKDTLDRVQYLHKSMKCDAIVEEYINGREIYVGVLGNKKLKIFPPRELFFGEVPESEPKFATYKAKWDDEYRKKWGIRTGTSKALPDGVEKQLMEIAKKVYQVLGMNGYGRLDFRLTPENRVVLIEANPNPSLLKDEDFALAAEKSGLKYSDLISEIITLALNRPLALRS